MLLFYCGTVLGFLIGVIFAALMGAAHDADETHVIPPPTGRL